MSARDLRHLLLALASVGLVCVLPIVLGAPVDLLLAAPVLLLALPLFAGRYVGEEALHRLTRRVAAQRRARPEASAVPARRSAALLARGGALLASALAVRPPPVAPVIR